jgi:hypothetical protein
MSTANAARGVMGVSTADRDAMEHRGPERVWLVRVHPCFSGALLPGQLHQLQPSFCLEPMLLVISRFLSSSEPDLVGLDGNVGIGRRDRGSLIWGIGFFLICKHTFVLSLWFVLKPLLRLRLSRAGRIKGEGKPDGGSNDCGCNGVSTPSNFVPVSDQTLDRICPAAQDNITGAAR